MSLDNCKQCGRIFQRSITPLCKSCLTYEQEQNLEMYRYIQENPGISMEELAEQFNMSIKEIESLIFSGVLGTANELIRTTCSMCECEMTFLNRVGYFCYNCNRFIEQEMNALRAADPNSKLSKLLKRKGVKAEDYLSREPMQEPVLKSEKAAKKDKEDESRWLHYGFKRAFKGTRRL